jgi:hypothetical protein
VHWLYVLSAFRFLLSLLSAGTPPPQPPGSAAGRPSYYAPDALRLGLSAAAAANWLGAALVRGLSTSKMPSRPEHTTLIISSALAWICYALLTAEVDQAAPTVALRPFHRAATVGWLALQLLCSALLVVGYYSPAARASPLDLVEQFSCVLQLAITAVVVTLGLYSHCSDDGGAPPAAPALAERRRPLLSPGAAAALLPAVGVDGGRCHSLREIATVDHGNCHRRSFIATLCVMQSGARRDGSTRPVQVGGWRTLEEDPAAIGGRGLG